MKPLTESDRKMLTEYLGECWHEVLIPSFHGDQICRKCNFRWRELIDYPWRTFTTIQDFYDLKEKAVENGEWDDFWSYCRKKFSSVEKFNLFIVIWKDSDFDIWIIHPDRCQTVADWLRGREK